MNSTQANSIAYSFSKETREEARKVANPMKEMREKSLPRENPGPAQYRSESLQLRPKPPCAVISQAQRFPPAGQFFQYKASV